MALQAPHAFPKLLSTAPHATTVPILVPSQCSASLYVNFVSSVAGFVAVELRHPNGTAIDGFRLEDADKLKGNAIASSWGSGVRSSLGSLAAAPVAVHVALVDAKLYSLSLHCEAEEGHDEVGVAASSSAVASKASNRLKTDDRTAHPAAPRTRPFNRLQ